VWRQGFPHTWKALVPTTGRLQHQVVAGGLRALHMGRVGFKSSLGRSKGPLGIGLGKGVGLQRGLGWMRRITSVPISGFWRAVVVGPVQHDLVLAFLKSRVLVPSFGTTVSYC